MTNELRTFHVHVSIVNARVNAKTKGYNLVVLAKNAQAAADSVRENYPLPRYRIRDIKEVINCDFGTEWRWSAMIHILGAILLFSTFMKWVRTYKWSLTGAEKPPLLFFLLGAAGGDHVFLLGRQPKRHDFDMARHNFVSAFICALFALLRRCMLKMILVSFLLFDAVFDHITPQIWYCAPFPPLQPRKSAPMISPKILWFAKQIVRFSKQNVSTAGAVGFSGFAKFSECQIYLTWAL